MRVLRMPWILFAASALGCGDAAAIRPGDIRVYTAPKPEEADRTTAPAATKGDPAPEAAE